MTTTDKPPYPQPREDQDNQAFLRAWREDGRILLQKAKGAARPFFYPRPMDPDSWSTDLEEITAQGLGHIVSYSAITRPNDPAFNDETPIILAEVELAEGARLLARIVGDDRAEAVSGAAVQVPAPEIARLYPLPVFILSRDRRP